MTLELEIEYYCLECKNIFKEKKVKKKKDLEPLICSKCGSSFLTLYSLKTIRK